MDCVLLPNSVDADIASELFRSLADVGEAGRVFVYLPDGTIEDHSRLLRLLIECSRDSKASISLIVPGSRLDTDILSHPYLPALPQVIIDADAQGLSESHLSVLESYQHRASPYKQRLTLWINADTGGATAQPLAGLFRLASAGFEVELQELQLGIPSSPRPSDVEHSGGISDPFPRCQVYENSLTVGRDGRVIACPRHDAVETFENLGGISTDSLESILLKKGCLSDSLSAFEVCRTCNLSSRLLWPETRGEYARELMTAGLTDQFVSPAEASLDWILATGQDVTTLGDRSFQRLLQELPDRLAEWSRTEIVDGSDANTQPIVSIETPVVKAGWLLPCIESVFRQRSSRWRLSLLWDGGDRRSREILGVLQDFHHPRVSVHFGTGVGIARARRFLTERSTGEYILPLDDDDLLKPEAVERFLDAATAAPWAGIIRARRDFVDESGGQVEMEDWFPFGPRCYRRGMTADLYNHGQPYLISRRAYEETAGWEGFEEYRFAGEDCDIFAKIEEVAEIELIDEVLYSYRLSDQRTSLELGTPAAEDMWRRLAVAALQRRGVPLSLESRTQPFSFSVVPPPMVDEDDVDVVVLADRLNPETDEQDVERWSVTTGVPADAVHIISIGDGDIHDIGRLLERSRRRFVCLMRGQPAEDSAAVIAALLEKLHAYDADVIGPKTIDSEGRLIVADPHFTSDLMPATAGRGDVDDGRFSYVAAVPWLPASLLLLRRYVLRSIPGLGVNLSGPLQDADFCLRARQRGFTCLYAGTVTAVCRPVVESARWADNARSFLDRWSRLPHLVFPEERAPEPRL